MHEDTIEFVPSSYTDSIYNQVHDDFHYGWHFYNDSSLFITKEHYRIITKGESPINNESWDYLIPPLQNIEVDFETNLSSLHTWDHVTAQYQLFNNLISITYKNETKKYLILKQTVNYLKVVVLKP